MRRLLPLLLAALVLILATALLTREPDRVPPRDVAARGPDYFLTGVVATETGLDGRLHQRLQASEYTHFPHDDSAVMVRPRLWIYEPPAPWAAQAARGRIEAGGERVLLDGGVRLSRELDGVEEITTETLQVFPEQRYAETAAPVTYRGDDRHIEAVGMELSLANQHLLLKSEVKGTYAP